MCLLKFLKNLEDLIMISTHVIAVESGSGDASIVDTQGHGSAVSWGAIIAGAAAAAALSLILLILGTGLGLSSVSPWANDGIGAKTFGVSTIVWITLTQLLASGMGGYLAGRLRTKWVTAQADEVYFRDSAHGFLAWAVATLTTAVLLTSVIGSIVSNGMQAGATVVGGAASTAIAATAGEAKNAVGSYEQTNGSLAYFVHSLFRKDITAEPAAQSKNGNFPNVEQGSATVASEVVRIFMNSITDETLPPEDVRYVGQVVAQHTGILQAEAEKRVTETYAKVKAKLSDAAQAAKEAADKTRKASAYAALWLFVSLLSGAFFASLAAIYGGRQRDL